MLGPFWADLALDGPEIMSGMFKGFELNWSKPLFIGYGTRWGRNVFYLFLTRNNLRTMGIGRLTTYIENRQAFSLGRVRISASFLF